MGKHSYRLAPERVPELFAHECMVYRRLADGTLKELSAMSGGRLVTLCEGETILATDIAWCLHYENWPKFHLTLLDGNPYNLRLDNIMPVRLGQLRYRETEVKGGYQHSLSDAVFNSSAVCRRNWADFAREHYSKDLPYVLRLEAEERQLRRESIMPPAKPARAKPVKRAAAPKQVERLRKPPTRPGEVWHWYNQAWLSVPEPVHVSDDYRERCRKVLLGAVRFEYRPDYQETWGCLEDGTVVL